MRRQHVERAIDEVAALDPLVELAPERAALHELVVALPVLLGRQRELAALLAHLLEALEQLDRRKALDQLAIARVGHHRLGDPDRERRVAELGLAVVEEHR